MRDFWGAQGFAFVKILSQLLRKPGGRRMLAVTLPFPLHQQSSELLLLSLFGEPVLGAV